MFAQFLAAGGKEHAAQHRRAVIGLVPTPTIASAEVLVVVTDRMLVLDEVVRDVDGIQAIATTRIRGVQARDHARILQDLSLRLGQRRLTVQRRQTHDLFVLTDRLLGATGRVVQLRQVKARFEVRGFRCDQLAVAFFRLARAIVLELLGIAFELDILGRGQRGFIVQPTVVDRRTRGLAIRIDRGHFSEVLIDNRVVRRIGLFVLVVPVQSPRVLALGDKAGRVGRHQQLVLLACRLVVAFNDIGARHRQARARVVLALRQSLSQRATRIHALTARQGNVLSFTQAHTGRQVLWIEAQHMLKSSDRVLPITFTQRNLAELDPRAHIVAQLLHRG